MSDDYLKKSYFITAVEAVDMLEATVGNDARTQREFWQIRVQLLETGYELDHTAPTRHAVEGLGFEGDDDAADWPLREASFKVALRELAERLRKEAEG